MYSNARVDTGLNPYQPNHRMKVPRVASTVEWPGMSRTTPVPGAKRPVRGPRKIAPIMQRRKLNLKATVESSLYYSTFKGRNYVP